MQRGVIRYLYRGSVRGWNISVVWFQKQQFACRDVRVAHLEMTDAGN